MKRKTRLVYILALALPVMILLPGIWDTENIGQVNRDQDDFIPPPPVGAGGVITRQVWCNHTSTDNVTLGGTITLYGYMIRDNGVGGWEYAVAEAISLFVDGMEITPNGTTDGNGNFTLPYTIPTGWPVTGTHNIIANLSRSSPYRALVFNINHPFNVYTNSKITPTGAFFGGYYLLGDSVTISGTLTSDSVPTHKIGGQTVLLTVDGSPFSLTTTSAGVANFEWIINSEDALVSFDFAGVPDDYLAASQQTRTIDTLQAGDVDIADLTYPSSTYEQNVIQISGTLVLASDGTTPLPNKRIVLDIYNATAEGATDAQGNFSLQITVPDGVTTRDLNFTLLYQNGMRSPVGALFPNALSVGSVFDPGNPANPIPYSLIFSLVGVVAAVIIFLVLIRKGVIKLKRARPVYEVNQKTLMDRVNALAAMGRLQEAMAYLLVKYLDALRFRMQMIKKRGQTVRDIATEAVRRHLHQAEILYPWTSFVEAAVYSGRAVTTKDLEHVKAFYQTAQQIVPFSEQELISLKPALEPETTPGQAMTQPPAPKNNEKGGESKNASR